MINVERYMRSIYTEKEQTHYVSVVFVVSPIYFKRDPNRLRVEHFFRIRYAVCPNFYPSYETEPIFSRPILRLRNCFHLPQPSRIYTSGQIDSISILLRSAGGRRALSRWTKLIVSLRCETILRDLPQRSRTRLIARRSMGDRSFLDNYQPTS